MQRIFRLLKTNKHKYVTVINSTIGDKRLSLKARGLLAWILSHHPTFKINIQYLQNNCDKDGRDSIKSALEELQHFGYAECIQKKTKDGRFYDKDWYFYELPKTDFP